jgi:glycosyltransferase involved in cell wall biosynthesis
MTASQARRVLTLQPVADGGGSEHALIGMIRQLTADGWECHVALPAPPRLASEYLGAQATLHVVPRRRLTSSGSLTWWLTYAATWPLSVLRLTRLARRLDVDVVHSNSLHCWYGWAVAALTGRPHVWHAREIVFQSTAALRVERWLARHFADRVVAVSEAVARQLDPANVTVAGDEADPGVFHPGRAGHFRTAAGVEDATPLLGSVARLDTWKGFDVLLDAFAVARRARPDLELVIAGGSVAGKEGYAAGLRDRATATPGVHWVGPRRDVAELMADLDVFAQVSTEPEPFGLVLVEALASGVPVVAGAAGGPLEILGDADPSAGRLVSPGDPDALASAVLSLLPAAPSTAEARRTRRILRQPASPVFADLFEQARSSRHRPFRAAAPGR